jgi:hypothetical protein
VDVHASDLVGIDGITRVLIVHIPQQDVCPRGHILPLRPPSYIIIDFLICPAPETAFK